MEREGDAGDRVPMRRVAPGGFVDFPDLLLYLDDLEAIEAAFRRAGYSNLQIRADHYEFDHASDLPLLNKGRVDQIEFKTEPLFSFETRGDQARIYRSDTDDPRQIGLSTQIEQIVRARTPPRKRGTRWTERCVVLLTRSTDPVPVTSNFYQRNRELVAAIAGAVVLAILTGIVSVILFALGILRFG